MHIQKIYNGHYRDSQCVTGNVAHHASKVHWACLSDRRLASVCGTLCGLFSNGGHASTTSTALFTSDAATLSLQAMPGIIIAVGERPRKTCAWMTTDLSVRKACQNLASHALCMHHVVLQHCSSCTYADNGIFLSRKLLQRLRLCERSRLTSRCRQCAEDKQGSRPAGLQYSAVHSCWVAEELSGAALPVL